MPRFLLVLCVLLAACATPAPAPEPAPPVPAAAATPTPGQPGGAVSAAHPLGAAAGMQILRAGGSAFDAAVATALVLGVVNPQSSGLGGGGFAVVRAADGSSMSLDFREIAPSFFDRDAYAAPGRSSSKGPWAAGIPGEAAGLAELHRRGGRLPWAQVVEPARALAADGFPVGPDLAGALKYKEGAVLADPGMRAVFAPEGTLLAAGETCRRPMLARTLEYLALHGGDALYSGPLAISLAGFFAAQGVPWTEAELTAYRVRERPVLSAAYRGYTVHSMGPPSSGGLALLETLAILDAAGQAELQPESPAWWRALAVGLSHSFADRAAYGGDPDHVAVPVADLLEAGLGARLWAASPAEGPVALTAAGVAGERGELAGLVPDDSGTSHLSVVDGEGNAIALTTTVNLLFGNKQLDPSTGIVLNDEMDDFAAKPGEPNAFGLVQGENNAVGPGRRPLSSMTPTLVTDPQGRFVLAVGAAGGPRIITATLQAVLGVLDQGLSPTEALARPRLHHQWLPATVLLEAAVPAGVRESLGAEGFVLDDMSRSGVAHAVARDPETGLYSGAADPRAGGAAEVWNP